MQPDKCLINVQLGTKRRNSMIPTSHKLILTFSMDLGEQLMGDQAPVCLYQKGFPWAKEVHGPVRQVLGLVKLMNGINQVVRSEGMTESRFDPKGTTE
jgi:hypothetical protein